MSWNYRVLERKGTYGIYEVYYDEKGIPKYCSEDPIKIEEESVDELVDVFNLIEKSFKKSILNYEDFK